MLQSTNVGDPVITIPANIFRYELATGNTGEKKVVEPLLNTEAKGKERARREFLDNGYRKRNVTLNTHRSDLKLNDIIVVKGLKYKIISIDISSDVAKVVFSIKGLRYE